jgi:tetrapyrrole methylase family protein/MazG family protein
MSSIVIAGLGIRGPEQVTDEVRRLVREVDIVFHSVSSPSTREWLEKTATDTRDLNDLYTDGCPRIETYRAMAAMVVECAASGATVMFAVYGHPCVLHTGVQLTVRSAASRHIPTRILPGVSSIDGMLAAAGIDFGFGGLHVLEASDMLMYGRMPQTEGHVVILQVAIAGPRVHRAAGHRGVYADLLIRRLATLYPPEHPALHFRLASDSSDTDSLVWTTVHRLADERWTNASSLYLPAARRASVDPVYAVRFGLHQ